MDLVSTAASPPHGASPPAPSAPEVSEHHLRSTGAGKVTAVDVEDSNRELEEGDSVPRPWFQSTIMEPRGFYLNFPVYNSCIYALAFHPYSSALAAFFSDSFCILCSSWLIFGP